MKSNISKKLTAQVIARDNARCRACGFTNATRQMEADHIVPESKGGKTTLDNLQCLCNACNKIKGDTQLPAMVILPPIEGFGDFDIIERNRDELTALVKHTKQNQQNELLELARQWKAAGTRNLTIWKRLNKITTSGKADEIFQKVRN